MFMSVGSCPFCPEMTRWFILHPHSNWLQNLFSVSQQPLHQNTHTSPDDASLQRWGPADKRRSQTLYKHFTRRLGRFEHHTWSSSTNACFLWQHCTQLLMHLQCNVIKEVSIDIMLIPRTAFMHLSNKNSVKWYFKASYFKMKCSISSPLNVAEMNSKNCNTI